MPLPILTSPIHKTKGFYNSHYGPPPPTEEDLMHCDLWVTCDLEYCRRHGCVNALLQERRRVRP